MSNSREKRLKPREFKLTDDQVLDYLYRTAYDGSAMRTKMLREKFDSILLKEISVKYDEMIGKDFGKKIRKQLKLGKTLKDASIPSYVLHSQLLNSRIKKFRPGDRILISACRWASLGRKLGLGDYCCDPCIVYHNSIVKAFDERFRIEFPRMLPKGDDVCEIVFSKMKLKG